MPPDFVPPEVAVGAESRAAELAGGIVQVFDSRSYDSFWHFYHRKKNHRKKFCKSVINCHVPVEVLF